MDEQSKEENAEEYLVLVAVLISFSYFFPINPRVELMWMSKMTSKYVSDQTIIFTDTKIISSYCCSAHLRQSSLHITRLHIT